MTYPLTDSPQSGRINFPKNNWKDTQLTKNPVFTNHLTQLDCRVLRADNFPILQHS